jgi:hydroxymethylpyrimidine/phosphomethylpyrimidine kinase
VTPPLNRPALNAHSVFNALTIAGSDPSGGAGIQADVKTFSALGAYATTVITALTAQNTHGVKGVHLVPAPFVAHQLEVLVSDVRIDTIKIGMLANAEVIETVTVFLGTHDFPFVVLDPVMVATSGDPLLAAAAVESLRDLMPLASIITPNIDEAAALLGLAPAETVAEMIDQAQALLARGAQRVLLKGGHLEHLEDAPDVFLDERGATVLTLPRIRTRNTHGTGCSLSSAMAALRPRRGDWLEATRDAKKWLAGALAAADSLEVGSGRGPVHHFFDAWGGR